MLMVSLVVLRVLMTAIKKRQKHSPLLNGNQLTMVAVLIALLGLGVWFGRGPILSEIGTIKNADTEYAFRKKLHASVMRTFDSRKVSGIGAGTFSLAFPFYQDPELPGYFLHAHCDPQEVLVDLGVVGSLILGAVLITMLLPSQKKRTRDSYDILRFGLFIALLGLALHSLVDFPFRLPVISFVAALFAGMLQSIDPPEVKPRRRRHRS
jgi:O-antigen ligase